MPSAKSVLLLLVGLLTGAGGMWAVGPGVPPPAPPVTAPPVAPPNPAVYAVLRAGYDDDVREWQYLAASCKARPIGKTLEAFGVLRDARRDALNAAVRGSLEAAGARLKPDDTTDDAGQKVLVGAAVSAAMARGRPTP